jgi:Ni,Fe-hydrogenase III large subunit/Ni,Fe-hydrogenase III component G
MKKFEKYLPKNVTPKLDDNVVTFEVSQNDIKQVIYDLGIVKELKLKLLDCTDERQSNGNSKIWYIFGVPGDNIFVIPYICVGDSQEFPSVANELHAAGYYERKAQSMFGLKPIGIPDNRQLILHENWPIDQYPLRKDFKNTTRPKIADGTYEFNHIDGDGIYEIPVGPIHAGIIEPGHFRFSMAGESIMLLEARLGFVHKGSEKLFEQFDINKQVKLSERISGDSTFSHSLAFCQAVEALADVKVPRRAQYLRVIYSELERLANHFGDIGAIMLDTGLGFGGINGQRLREIVMRRNKTLTGSRFLRDVNAIGGVTKDISDDQAKVLIAELVELVDDFTEVIEIANSSSSFIDRVRNTGKLPLEVAIAHNVVGVAGRAVGLNIDTRIDYPYAAYSDLSSFDISTETKGDVQARFNVRIKEIYTSKKLIIDALSKMPSGKIKADDIKLDYKPNSLKISCVEGWRGEILYAVFTNKNGIIDRVMVRDPSFINWQVVGYCGPGNIVPDFPLINKSFNLSYTGHDA